MIALGTPIVRHLVGAVDSVAVRGVSTVTASSPLLVAPTAGVPHRIRLVRVKVRTIGNRNDFAMALPVTSPLLTE